MKERKRNRLRGFNYSANKLYYVTSCVHDRVCCFGEIKSIDQGTSQEMILNEYEEVAQKQWYWLAEQYSYGVLHAFIVMPDHIHGIIEIDSSRTNDSVKIKSLFELIGAFKTTVSKQIHLLERERYRDRSRPVPVPNVPFSWQRSFYECIIHNRKAYENISEYINNNPAKWKSWIQEQLL